MTISFIIKTFTFGTMIFWEQIKCWSLLSVKESKKKWALILVNTLFYLQFVYLEFRQYQS